MVDCTHYVFIDESGDHSLQHVNQDFPYFLLCSVIISVEEYNIFEQKINELKHFFFGTSKVIFHSRDIRKHDGHFSKLFDPEIKQDFYEKLNTIITDTDFTIIANGVRKNDYIKLYGKSAINPYHISLSYLLERTIFYLDELPKSSCHIMVEMRGKKEDKELLQHYNTVLDTGTYYVDDQRFQQRIDDFTFRSKYKNDVWIQLADLCAYPLISYIRYPDNENPAYKLLHPKIYKNPKTWHLSWFKTVP